MSHLELETRNTAITGAGRGDISGNLNSCGIVAARTDELITSRSSNLDLAEKFRETCHNILRMQVQAERRPSPCLL